MCKSLKAERKQAPDHSQWYSLEGPEPMKWKYWHKWKYRNFGLKIETKPRGEGTEALEPVAQRGCGVAIFEDTQTMMGQTPEQCALAAPAFSMAGGQDDLQSHFPPQLFCGFCVFLSQEENCILGSPAFSGSTFVVERRVFQATSVHTSVKMQSFNSYTSAMCPLAGQILPS